MDIIKEIGKLPTYVYTFEKDGKACLAFLGGQSCRKITEIKYSSSLWDKNIEMRSIYKKENLSIEEKTKLAKLMHQIATLCEGRLEENYTLDQQSNYLSSLSDDALTEIKEQVQMYKDAREYYGQFLC